jgi:hypothetical protein
MQHELIRMGLSLTIQQLCEEGNLGSRHEYGDLFLAWASCATIWQNKLTNKNSFSKVCHEQAKSDV